MPFTTVPDLLARFDRHVAGAHEAMQGVSDTAMRETWTPKNRGASVFSLPRISVLRGFVLNHLIHHRGQMSVYLRLQNVAVPSIYGPSADEAM